MPYAKLQWLAYSDQALGIQSINQAQANLLEHLNVLTLRHGGREPATLNGHPVSFVAAPFLFGNHNDVRIPRSMGYLSTVAVVSGTVAGLPFGAPLLGASTQNVVSRLDRISTGMYFAAVVDLAQYFANPTPTTPAAGNVRRVRPTVILPTQQGEPGIFFQCDELDGGNVWQPTDFDFSFAVYGTV